MYTWCSIIHILWGGDWTFADLVKCVQPYKYLQPFYRSFKFCFFSLPFSTYISFSNLFISVEQFSIKWTNFSHFALLSFLLHFSCSQWILVVLALSSYSITLEKCLFELISLVSTTAPWLTLTAIKYLFTVWCSLDVLLSTIFIMEKILLKMIA